MFHWSKKSVNGMRGVISPSSSGWSVSIIFPCILQNFLFSPKNIFHFIIYLSWFALKLTIIVAISNIFFSFIPFFKCCWFFRPQKKYLYADIWIIISLILWVFLSKMNHKIFNMDTWIHLFFFGHFLILIFTFFRTYRSFSEYLQGFCKADCDNSPVFFAFPELKITAFNHLVCNSPPTERPIFWKEYLRKYQFRGSLKVPDSSR